MNFEYHPSRLLVGVGRQKAKYNTVMWKFGQQDVPELALSFYTLRQLSIGFGF